jgi:hypothetical protein
MPIQQKTCVDICFANLAQGSNEQPIDVTRAPALVAPRATRGSLRDSHRGRSRGAAAECARVSARGAGAEESSPVRRVSRRVARTSVAHLVSEATTGGRVSVARRGEARRGLGLSGRVASAPARSRAIERTRRRRPDPASSGDARARERESVPFRGKKDASAARI